MYAHVPYRKLILLNRIKLHKDLAHEDCERKNLLVTPHASFPFLRYSGNRRACERVSPKRDAGAGKRKRG